MRIVIAEDEMLERKAMRKFLEEHFHDMEVVGEAVNGRTAIELAESLMPDIMLMDIKMPGLNGLEAMEKIYLAHPMIKFIMVTAYDSFDYAKQAMKIGVREYILKPSKKGETIRAIRRVESEINKERQIIESRRSLFLTKLIQGEDAAELQQSLFPDMQSGFFFVMSEQVDLPAPYIQYQKIGFYPSQSQLDNATVLKKMRQLQLETGIYIGIGHPYSQLEQLSHSYYEAKQALRRLTEAGQKQYGFPPKQIETTDITPFMAALHEGDEQQVWSLFDEIAAELDMEAYFKIKQMIEQKGCHFPDMAVENLYSKETWHDFIHLVCLELRHYYHSKNKMERARQYIEDHYHEQISLEDVSSYTNLSTNYLSNSFREATGTTFSDYLTEIRITKAKEMLQQNQATLKQISSDVGYRDPNYFSRVFKKQVGLSPKQYQQHILK
ncbi:response regulator [Gracilibacillus caseinilyticus]|uniref:Response regulator n=1 Tax=Gracilibacillus caseinilyticus TaxID=2932256 RepID=A0ABY4F199_9BACI|nr:response regulator [Gracilibacillus caseinilyticus]UOQ50308.1 response regulator [Gracilibacillus caseinilyticus]